MEDSAAVVAAVVVAAVVEEDTGYTVGDIEESLHFVLHHCSH